MKSEISDAPLDVMPEKIWNLAQIDILGSHINIVAHYSRLLPKDMLFGPIEKNMYSLFLVTLTSFHFSLIYIFKLHTLNLNKILTCSLTSVLQCGQAH